MQFTQQHALLQEFSLHSKVLGYPLRRQHSMSQQCCSFVQDVITRFLLVTKQNRGRPLYFKFYKVMSIDREQSKTSPDSKLHTSRTFDSH